MNWLLGLWLIGLSLVLSLAMSFHMSALRITPAPSSMMIAQTFETKHFLSGKCACSKKVLQHLVNRKPIKEANETVYLIGEDFVLSSQLIEAGFRVQAIDEATAEEKFHVEALPFMRISSFGKIFYEGAYGKDQKHSPVYEDESIIQSALKGEPRRAFPLFGCINGKLRRNQMDRLGLKHEKN